MTAAAITGPTDKTDAATFEHDGEENLDPMADDQDDGEDDYAEIYAEDHEPAVCGNLYDGN